MAGDLAQGGKAERTRAQIAHAALDLFSSQGFAETTIDQIAETAGVSRRTVFHHFASKETILLDHLLVQREELLRHLETRPKDEPVLASLHVVLREFCQHGYDRRFLDQIRTIIAAEPQFASARLAGTRELEERIIQTLQSRAGNKHSALELKALTAMAMGWSASAAHLYLVEGRRSLVDTFDKVVATCLAAAGRDLS
jgi:AcrR family transcriptional regulator